MAKLDLFHGLDFLDNDTFILDFWRLFPIKIKN